VPEFGGAEIASTGKCMYGKVKYEVAKCVRVQSTSTEIQVRLRKDGKRKDGNWKYE